MKKVTLLTSMLLTLGLFSACSSDEEMSGNGGRETILIPTDGEVLTPVEDRSIAGYEDLSRFFASQMPIGARSNSFFVNSDQDEFSAINSLTELKGVYKGTEEIPHIDFEHYTLVLGQTVKPGACYPVLRQNLEFLNNSCQQNLYVPNLEGRYTMSAPIYYWALYPKFRTEGIITNIIKEGSLKTVNLSGQLRYITNIGWYISYSVVGMYESKDYYILNPTDLPAECTVNKEDGTNITLSGESFENYDAIMGLYAGTQLWPSSSDKYLIYISNVEKAE